MSRKAHGLVWVAKASLAQNAIKLQYLLVYKTTVVKKDSLQQVMDQLSVLYGNFMGYMLKKWTQHWLSGETVFHLIGCVKSLNIICTENPLLIHGMPLRGVRVHV
jgi:hypothetical protein